MIVVTGGAGFIGSALIWELNRKGVHDILVVDSLKKTEKWRNLVNLQFTDYMEKQNFLELITESDSLKNVTGILHMGACSSTTETDASYLMTNNYEYTKRLAIWCMQRKKRFVYASSAATYGDGSLGFSDNHEQIPTLRPLNGYGFSKNVFDLSAQLNGVLDKIAGIKFFNVFGPNEYHKDDMRSVVHKTFQQIQHTGEMKLFKSHNPNYKDGWQLRDFVYVKDAVSAVLHIYERPELNGIFNIGTGKARSFYELTSAVFHAMGVKENIEYIDMPEHLRSKYQYFTQADISKLRDSGFKKEFFSLEDAVEDYVKNYLLKDNQYLGN